MLSANGAVLNENAENIPLQKIKLDAPPIHAFEREEITDVFETGIKSIDSMLTIGIGQKLVFSLDLVLGNLLYSA